MKRFIYIAAALLTMAACTQNNDIQEVKAPQRNSITVVAGESATKTYMSHDFSSGQYKFYWQAGDNIKLIEYVAETQSSDIQASDALTEDARQASFTVNNLTQTKDSDQKFHYIAVYPASTAVSITADDWYGSGADAYPAFTVDIPQKQVLTPASSSLYREASFDPAADILVSRIVDADTRPESIEASFTRVGGILMVHFTCADLFGGRNNYLVDGSVTVDDENYRISGPCIYATKERMFEYEPAENSISSISFTGGSAYVMTGSGNSVDVYLRCCSGEITGHFSVMLHVNVDGVIREFRKEFDVNPSGSSSGSSSGKIVIDDGGITEMSISLSEHFPVVFEIVEDGIWGETDDGPIYDVATQVASDFSAEELVTTVYYNTGLAYSASELEFMNGTQSCTDIVQYEDKIYAILGSLPELTTYYYCFKISAPDGKDYYSAVYSFTTKKILHPVEEPELHITVNGDSFTATWTHVSGAIDYTCYYYANPENKIALTPTVTGNGGTPVFSVSVAGLESGTYFLEVTPVPDADHTSAETSTAHQITI